MRPYIFWTELNFGKFELGRNCSTRSGPRLHVWAITMTKGISQRKYTVCVKLIEKGSSFK